MRGLDVYVPNPESDPVAVKAHAAIVGRRITLIDDQSAIVVQMCGDISGFRFADRCQIAFGRFAAGYVHAFAGDALLRVGSFDVDDGRVVLDDLLAELQLARWLGDGYDTIEPPDLDRRELEVGR